ncbi:arginine/serine-rich protein 1 isoform X1 [Varanus komodoensis]|uniref:Arginine/serine-rich protein 1 n=2 Tax=Varanus komodoensis TaxID=61221 RepID=A0A8D2J7N5_VARKO|nr:arginine/serine-rich protein 1 isoform X1 [Varanus komodoensis]
MAITNETGLSPQAPPQGQAPSSWYQSPQQVCESSEQNRKSAAAHAMGNGQLKTEVTFYKNIENPTSSKKTDEMTDFMDDLTLSSPKEKSRSSSRSSYSRKSSSRSSSRSSYSSQSSSSTSSSRSWSRSRSRSSSRAKRNCSRRNRRYSRSYSRSRSRSRSYRYRERYHPRYYRRYRRSPPRYRSRSRSPRRSYYRRSYSRSRSRSRKYYGFGRTIYPEAYRSWRSRSRSRSRSRTPLRLTEKEKRELLEIAKANAAKTFGPDISLPASLRMNPKSNENVKPKDDSIGSKMLKESQKKQLASLADKLLIFFQISAVLICRR